MNPRQEHFAGTTSRKFGSERSLGRLTVPVLVSSLLLSGCGSSEDDTSAVTVTHTETMTAPPQPVEVVQIVIAPNACNPTEEYRDEANATECLRRKDLGKVAFVAFDNDPADSTAIADGIEQTITAVTYGDINPEVEAVVPSPEAIQAHKDLALKDCVNKDETNIASLARQTMPELADYDYIIGATPLPDCNQKTAGLAFLHENNADVYGLNEDTDRSIHIGAHELGHLYGLGHAGSEYKGQLVFSSSNEGILPTVDFSHLQTSIDYEEYGEWTVMGSGHPSNPHYPLNSVQLHGLAWPERMLGNDEAESTKQVNRDEVRLDAFGNIHQEIAVLDLLKPLTAKTEDSDTHHETVTFDKLAIQYVSREMTNGQSYPRAFLTLTSSEGMNNTLTLAELEDSWDKEEGSRSFRVNVGAQKLRISFEKNQLTIKDVTDYTELQQTNDAVKAH